MRIELLCSIPWVVVPAGPNSSHKLSQDHWSTGYTTDQNIHATLKLPSCSSPEFRLLVRHVYLTDLVVCQSHLLKEKFFLNLLDCHFRRVV